ncbi:MAG TPA: TIGR03009 domain-containing protein [Gemmata sp.]|nr:TIGR03009 domain-containing protein [Gemmata sp.]
MRYAGFTLAVVLIGVVAAHAQQPVAGAPVAPPGAPGAAPGNRLDAHLDGWEKKMGDLTNFRFVLSLKRTNPTFPNAPKSYSGVVLCMKPNYAVLRLNYDADKTGNEYEAFICDGKKVYEYNGLARTITHWPLPDPKASPAGATDNLMLDFLSGMKARDAKDRFDITLYKEDEKGHYIYLDVKPKLAKDKAEFQQLRMALYGPNTKYTYLPAQVFLVKPGGDTEQWSFKEPQTNIPGLTAKDFTYQKVAGFRDEEGKPPAPQGAARPGMPKLPAGGAVRPNR